MYVDGHSVAALAAWPTLCIPHSTVDLSWRFKLLSIDSEH